MKISIIGAGFIGRAVAKLGVAAGHQVMVSNSRGPRSLASIPSGIGCEVGTVADAIAFGDIVVVAIPLYQYPTIPVAPLEGRIVLDAGNYYPERDGHIDELDSQAITTSERLARHLPQSRIVKAFNAIQAVDLERDGRPAGAHDRRALPVAGNDVDAKAAAIRLLDRFGFDTVDGGSLADSWRFERAQPCYCVSLDREGLIRALAQAQRGGEVPADM